MRGMISWPLSLSLLSPPIPLGFPSKRERRRDYWSVVTYFTIQNNLDSVSFLYYISEKAWEAIMVLLFPILRFYKSLITTRFQIINPQKYYISSIFIFLLANSSIDIVFFVVFPSRFFLYCTQDVPYWLNNNTIAWVLGYSSSPEAWGLGFQSSFLAHLLLTHLVSYFLFSFSICLCSSVLHVKKKKTQ